MTASPLKADSRAAFEKWVRAEFPVWGKYLLWSESLDAYGYSTTNLMYRAWQASRAAIVVELPDPHAHLIWIQAGYAPDDYWDDVEVSRSEKDKCCDGSPRYAVYAEHEVVEILRAAGITVKGDSE